MSDEVSPWEIPFAIDIGLDVPLVGRIDGLCKHRDSGELMAWELKTSSELSARVVTGFEMNTQVCAYTLALRTYTGEKVSGVMMDFIGVNKTGPRDEVHPIRVLDHQLDAFIKEAHFWGSIILECEKRGEFIQEFSGCTPYQMYGQPGYVCEYKNLCQVQDWTTLKQYYQVRTDRPFDLASVKEIRND